MDHGLNCKAPNYKNFRNSHSRTSSRPRLDKEFLDLSLKAQPTEENINKLSLFKIKNCSSIKRRKRQATKWE